MNRKVTGIGGVFFKAENVEDLKKWYEKNLGMKMDEYGSSFRSRQLEDPDKSQYLQWSLFPADTEYFNPSGKEFMINYRVHDLEALVRDLKTAGVTVCDEIESYEYGKFVHILDPEGNKIELWEPVDKVFDDYHRDREEKE